MTQIEQAKAALGEEFSFFFEVVFEQLQSLELTPDARILDVGTGTGVSAITAALVESVRERFPDHPDPTDPAPLLDASQLDAARQTTHGEKFDAHVIRVPR